MTLCGLAPVFASDARVLVLGSFPGERSLASQQYYAHPQNRFWPTMGAACGFDPRAPYAERLDALRASGVALWDVLGACVRVGSLDSAIVLGSETANDFGTLFERCAGIRGVLFNGQKARQSFARHVVPEEIWEGSGLAFVTLPSTSPAHAAVRRNELVQRWREALGALTRD